VPNWEEIKTFLAVARNRTARNAAKSLQVHHTTVSRRLEELEASMNARLFDRHPDGYVLTTSGERLFAVACRFEEEILGVSREISGTQDRLSGTLRITMTPPLAAIAFTPNLRRFCDKYPEIEVELIATYGHLDISRREADVAIRLDNNPPPEGLVGRRLFRYRQTLYATPEYLAEHNLESHPEAARLLGCKDDGVAFPEWARGTACEAVPVWGYFSELSVLLAAARGGLGIALLPCLIADQDDQLVRATPEPPTPARDVWLVTHRDLMDTSRVRVFMDFAEEVLGFLEPAMLGVRGKSR